MNWKFWTWGEPRIQPREQETFQSPPILREDPDVKPALSTSKPLIPIQQPVLDDPEDDEEADEALPLPNFQVPAFTKNSPVPDAYTILTTCIGFATPEMTEAKLNDFFRREQIGIATCADVREWLTDNLDNIDSYSWYWRPLRQKDEMIQTYWGNAEQNEYDSDEWACRIYDKPIPERVLRRIKQMIDEFGDTIRFFVSDFEDHDYQDRESADIFIMAFPSNYTPDSDEEEDFFFVFDTWSKPGYDPIVPATASTLS